MKILFFCTVFFLGVGSIAHAQLSFDAGLLAEFAGLQETWLFNLFPVANGLFWGLAGLEFISSAILWKAAGHHLDQLSRDLVVKILFISVSYWILLGAGTLLPIVISSFREAGTIASGVALLSPQEIFLQGLGTGVKMLNEMAGLGLINPFTWPGFIIGMLSAIVVVGAFAFVAFELAVTLMESYLVMGAGVFMLAFAPFRGTAAITERYLGFMIAVGIKLFVIQILIGAGGHLAPIMASFITGTSIVNFHIPITVAALSLLFAVAARRIPAITSSIALGGVNLSANDLVHATISTIRTAAAVAAAAVSGGALATGTMSVARAAAATVGGGAGGALTGTKAGAGALIAEGARMNVPRLQMAADAMEARAENIAAGRGNTRWRW